MYINPYEAIEGEGAWLRGSFHIHAGTGEGTCGHYAIRTVAESYQDCGYNVLMFSNHDIYSDTSKLAEELGLTLINGFEYSTDGHMLCINTKSLIEGDHQAVIDEARKQGGFVVICHPRWHDGEYWTAHDILNMRGASGMEIYNGVIFRLDGSGLATDIWDQVLSAGRLVWGYANDDFHRWYDMAKAWNMIYSQPGVEAVTNALRQGCFYATTGLKLTSFAINGGEIRVSAQMRSGYPQSLEYAFIGKNGEILSVVNDPEGASYHIKPGQPYIRVRISAPFGAMLWTQPVYDPGYISAS